MENRKFAYEDEDKWILEDEWNGVIRSTDAWSKMQLEALHDLFSKISVDDSRLDVEGILATFNELAKNDLNSLEECLSRIVGYACLCKFCNPNKTQLRIWTEQISNIQAFELNYFEDDSTVFSRVNLESVYESGKGKFGCFVYYYELDEYYLDYEKQIVPFWTLEELISKDFVLSLYKECEVIESCVS